MNNSLSFRMLVARKRWQKRLVGMVLVHFIVCLVTSPWLGYCVFIVCWGIMNWRSRLWKMWIWLKRYKQNGGVVEIDISISNALETTEFVTPTNAYDITLTFSQR